MVKTRFYELRTSPAFAVQRVTLTSKSFKPFVSLCLILHDNRLHEAEEKRTDEHSRGR